MVSPRACLGYMRVNLTLAFGKKLKCSPSSRDKSSGVALLVWVRDRMWH